MEFATGAMGALVPKLGQLLQKEYNLQNSVKERIADLKVELECMQAAIVKLSSVPLDQLDPLVKIWANKVRELSYAIEDNLDSSMLRIEGPEPTERNITGLIKKTRNKIGNLKARREIANDIKCIEMKVRKVREQFDRYKIDDVVANAVTSVVDPRLSSLYNKASDLVGIGNAIDELIRKLFEAGDLSERKLRTVSVVGFGGLGKTTLAKAVYDKLSKNFDCGGFVPVGRNPDKRKVLRDILPELDKQRYKCITASKMDERQLIDEMRDFLADKRYLIVIDDIWDISTWETIKYAFLDSNPRSIVIITTRVYEVAKKVGGVYNKKSLSYESSKKLFYSRVCGNDINESIRQCSQFSEVTNKILRKCDGVPLSIITIASLLVGKQREDWSKVYDNIGFGHDDSAELQNTRKIISFSYYDLPSYLKACLLYMIMFVEDALIEKNMLIWKWIAEGFIPGNEEMGTLFEQGENYFNKLVDRSMIRWIEPSNMATLGHCCVHDMVRDLICTISPQVNFATILDTELDMPRTPSKSYSNVVRRLAIHKTCVEHNPSMDTRYLRSFAITLCTHGRMPSLLSFKVLRVLVLDNCDFSSSGGCHLHHLGKLVQLRYMGLVNTYVVELPKELGHQLKFLQTLDIRRSGIEELPMSVSELKMLMCLHADEGTRLVSRIGKLTSLEELHLHHVDKSPEIASELGNLTRLRVLDIHFDEIDAGMHKALVKSLSSLRRIQNLQVWYDVEDTVHVGGWEEYLAPPSELHELSLCGITLPRRPVWMDFSCVPLLSYLWLNLEEVEPLDMEIIGTLQSLRFLFLMSHGDCLSYTVGNGEFQNLRYFDTNIEIICGGERALPVLEELESYASVGKQGSYFGLTPGNMPFLKKVTYWLDCEGRGAQEAEVTVEALRHAAEIHPNRPTLRIKRVNDHKSDDEDIGTGMVSE